MSDTEKKVLFGSFTIRPNEGVTEDQIAKAVEKALSELGNLSRLYVGDDQIPPQSPPPPPPHK